MRGGGNVSFFDLLSALFFLLLFLKFVIGRGGGVTPHRVYVNVLLVITSYVLDGECVSYALGEFLLGPYVLHCMPRLPTFVSGSPPCRVVSGLGSLSGSQRYIRRRCLAPGHASFKKEGLWSIGELSKV